MLFLCLKQLPLIHDQTFMTHFSIQLNGILTCNNACALGHVFVECACVTKSIVFDTYLTDIFDTNLSDLGLDSRAHWCKKAKTSASILSTAKNCLSIQMKLGVLFRLIGLMNLIYIFYIVWLIFKADFNVGLHSDIYLLISFKLCMMMKTTKPYILIPVWMTLIELFAKSKASPFIFSQISHLIFKSVECNHEVLVRWGLC